MKEIKYNRVGDYEFPELKQERPLPNLSRFGREYLRILKEKHPGHYLSLRARNELNEELKEKDQMKWVREMYDTKNFAEEMLMDEYMYLILI